MRRHRIEQGDVETGGRRGLRLAQESQGGFHLRRFGAQQRLVAIGRKFGLLALGQQAFGKAVVIVPDQRLEQRVGGKLGLDQHFAGQGVAPGAPGNLHQLREQALRGAEIGAVERAVRIHHPDQGELLEVVAFARSGCR